MKIWICSGRNFKGQSILNVEIEARTKNAAIKKFNDMYGNICTRIEEK